MNELKQAALKEKAIRVLEERHKDKRESLVEYIDYFFRKELNKPFQRNWHYDIIAEKLTEVLEGKCNRLIINIPPGTGKTELVTKCFPTWALGVKPETQIIATGYSSNLTQSFGSQARDYYESDTYNLIFPRKSNLRQDQNTKALWKNEAGGQYLAAGVGGTITGQRANIFIIDDPIKPDEAVSEVKREAVNRWFDNTVMSRLFDPRKDAVIVIAQRTHENDLCGYLMHKETEGGMSWDRLVIPAIAVVDDVHRKLGEPIHPDRLPLESLELIRDNDPAVFSTQYQQEPVNKEAQEFHEEFFRYYEEVPTDIRTFTIVDPGFKTKKENDPTCILTGGFDKKGNLYLLEYSNIREQASGVIDKVLYHCNKWKPEKVGVEAYQAQTVLGQFLKKAMREKSIFIPVDEVTQKGSKEEKIRKLDYPIRNGMIFWRRDMHELESQLKTFPRGRHDDIIDALQMLYSIYQIRPNLKGLTQGFKVSYDSMGRPSVKTVGDDPFAW
jgi:predicted phage terminase large subunit-like protein